MYGRSAEGGQTETEEQDEYLFHRDDWKMEPKVIPRVHTDVNASYQQHNAEAVMLWAIFVVLMVLWLIGLIGFQSIGAYIHILLVLAIVVVLIRIIQGRKILK